MEKSSYFSISNITTLTILLSSGFSNIVKQIQNLLFKKFALIAKSCISCNFMYKIHSGLQMKRGG